MAETLHVLALWKAKPGREDELRALLAGLVEPTRTEEGCLRYELLESREDPGAFAFVEAWKDQDALDDHFNTEHVADALSRASELVAREPDLLRYRQVR